MLEPTSLDYSVITYACCHVHTDKKQSINMRRFFLPSHLWITLLTSIFLISISPHSCSGACANTYFNRALTLTLTRCHINLDPHTVVPPFRLIPPKYLGHSHIAPPPPATQRSCRSPRCSSKTPLAHASSSLHKVIAPTVRIDQSWSGMYQTSPT